MKKQVLFFGVLCFLLAGRASANSVSTFDFEGFYHYSGSGAIDPIAEIAAAGFDGGLLPSLGDGGPYYGTGAVAYQLDLHLPDPDKQYSWASEYQLLSNGEEYEWVAAASDYVHTTTNVDRSEAFDLGGFASGMTDQDLADFISSIPTSGYITSMRTFVGDLATQVGLTPADTAFLLDEIDDELGAIEYLFDGNTNRGSMLWAMDENVYDNDPVEYERATFRGSIQLSTKLIPEPSTLELLLLAAWFLTVSRYFVLRLPARR
jgi:hypothetical protein